MPGTISARQPHIGGVLRAGSRAEIAQPVIQPVTVDVVYFVREFSANVEQGQPVGEVNPPFDADTAVARVPGGVACELSSTPPMEHARIGTVL
jgi:hypothetical protein